MRFASRLVFPVQGCDWLLRWSKMIVVRQYDGKGGSLLKRIWKGNVDTLYQEVGWLQTSPQEHNGSLIIFTCFHHADIMTCETGLLGWPL